MYSDDIKRNIVTVITLNRELNKLQERYKKSPSDKLKEAIKFNKFHIKQADKGARELLSSVYN